MPVEIRELVIKMVVEDNANNKSSTKSGKQANGTHADERLVNICVEKVLEVLKNKMER